MKALILAAGYGTRLHPYTETYPKPLFPINGKAILSRVIDRLISAGCTGIIINTHHLHEQIESFIANQSFPVPVLTRYEPAILGTGGAIRNVSDFLDNAPFLVINSDIVTDLDLKAVYAYHCGHAYPATMVMHDHKAFNSVAVDPLHFISAFTPERIAGDPILLAFTGIQVLDRQVLAFIPEGQAVSSIDIYQAMLDQGALIKAYVPDSFYWQDIGTPERYCAAVFDQTAPAAFFNAFDYRPAISDIRTHQLTGDGSDRKWYRLIAGDHSMILADHGMQTRALSEIDSFLALGRHLFQKSVPVPQIYLHERFAGLVFLEDLGDTLLYDWITPDRPEDEIISIYQAVIQHLSRMAVSGAEGFDPATAYQGPAYDRSLILEKECRYFVDAFLNGYLHLDQSYAAFYDEFSRLADRALENSVFGFMHRDCQSRNIMIKNGNAYFIDFQGGRIGPVQYDLAALLSDPYTALPEPMQAQLLEFALNELKNYREIDSRLFLKGYAACRLCRLLQALGAFGFLTRVKQKSFFHQFIPVAVNTLKKDLANMPEGFPRLCRAVETAAERVEQIFFSPA